eukprot:761684-Hanusia_phi.AAC.6
MPETPRLTPGMCECRPATAGASEGLPTVLTDHHSPSDPGNGPVPGWTVCSSNQGKVIQGQNSHRERRGPVFCGAALRQDGSGLEADGRAAFAELGLSIAVS